MIVKEIISLAGTAYNLASSIYQQAKTYNLNKRYLEQLSGRVECVVEIIKSIEISNPSQETLAGLEKSLSWLNQNLTLIDMTFKELDQKSRWQQIKGFFSANTYKNTILFINDALDACVALVNLGFETQLMKNYQRASKEFLDSLEGSKKEILAEIIQIQSSQSLQSAELAEILSSLNKFHEDITVKAREKIDRLSIGNNIVLNSNASLIQGDITHSIVSAEGDLSNEDRKLIDDELKRQEDTGRELFAYNDAIINEGASLCIGNVTSARLTLKKETKVTDNSRPSERGLFPPSNSNNSPRPASPADKAAIKAVENILNKAYPEDDDPDNIKYRQEIMGKLQPYRGKGLIPLERKQLKELETQISQGIDQEEDIQQERVQVVPPM
ncbi:MAG: hypothetical protein K2X39_00065 [Silvanigrellaceae bacterium]|nr:hypothetical protein [Silvanigrellaceae bacterium]